MKLLCTGGAGFIGSHVSEAFLKDGHDVHIIDDLSAGKRANVPAEATFHHLDIRSTEAAALVKTEAYEMIVHHAAQMNVRESVKHPREDASVNIDGMLNLMEAGRNHGLKRVLFASTGGAIYGDPAYTPQDEDHPLCPVSPYGVSKLACEKYLNFYREEYGIPYVSLRYANVYGPRQNPAGEAGVIAIFIEKMLNGEAPVIYGDGTQTRDYIYIDDVVAINRAVMDIEGTRIFNVGTGKETSLNELFRQIQAHTAPSIDNEYGPAQPGEQMRSVLDISRAERELGWSPKTEMSYGIRETVQWFEKSQSRARTQ
ncbi:MAG: GDP-mannose 4,6-dehydratase [Longimonas sp.]|uniref:NAD-dependent epimerase/dehydratase family protein n=1 Tax=Longimonas sp. TaxID=2039626 RepID=UPI00336254E3